MRHIHPQPSRPPAPHRQRDGWLVALRAALRALLFVLVVGMAAACALPSLLLGLCCWFWAVTAYDPREFQRGLLAVSIFGVGVYGLWLWLADPLPWLWRGILFALTWHLLPSLEHLLGWLWAFNLWLAPLCGLLLVHLAPVSWPSLLARFCRGQMLPLSSDRTSGGSSAHQGVAQVPSVLAPAVLAMLPRSQTGHAVLGAYQWGELEQWVSHGELCIPPNLLELHGLLLGEPQMGKTWTLIRLAAIAQQYGRKVIYIDMKGSQKTAALFLATMSLLQIKQIKIYPIEAYDGWRGTPKALYNRLMEQIDPRSHPFYRTGVGSTLVSLACHAPGGMPRNSYEFLARLDADWLKAAYAGDGQALREIEALEPHLQGAHLVFAGFFRGIAGGLDGSWAFEDGDACYIGIDSIANKEEAALLGRYLLEDAADYATARKSPDEHVLLIIDEFGGLRSTNATALYEKVREAGMSVYAAAQSYQSLGEERDQVVASSFVKILHRTGDPRPIVAYAGEREQYAYARVVAGSENDEDVFHPLANHVREERAQGMQTMMRPETVLTVPVEDVQQLERGQIALISGGRGGFVQVYPLAIPEPLIQAATSLLQAAPPFTPLTPPPASPTSAKPKQGRKKKIAASPSSSKTNVPSQGAASSKNRQAGKGSQRSGSAGGGERPLTPQTEGQGMPQLPVQELMPQSAQSSEEQKIDSEQESDDEVIDFYR